MTKVSTLSKNILTVWLLSLSFFSWGCTLIEVPPHPEVVELAQILTEEIQHELKDKKIPSFSIALIRGQETLWSRGFGLAQLEEEVPANSSTIYRVGSVSKLLTGISVMKLVEAGKLNLDAPVKKYLSDFNPKNKSGIPITLRHLMAHRSGLVRESPVGSYFDATSPSLKDTVLSLNQTELVYLPGQKQKYSNVAVSVLGRVIEEVTGDSFEDHIRKEVLIPLGMATATYKIPESSPLKAEGYMWGYDRRPYPAKEFLLGTSPAGNLYASVHDLSQFAKFLLSKGRVGGQQFLSEESLLSMWEPQFSTPDKPGRFGLSFSVGKMDQHKTVGHNGAVYGFSTSFIVIPELDLAVAAVASMDVVNATVDRIARRALRGMINVKDGKELDPYVPPQPLPPKLARGLDGVYENGLSLSNREGQLFLDLGTYVSRIGERHGKLVSDDRHTWETPLEISPVDESVRARGHSYKRLEDKLPAPCPDEWKSIIGEYGWDHNVLYIHEKNGKLYALIEWIFSYPLTQESEGVFSFPNYGLYHGEKIIFNKATSDLMEGATVASVFFPRRDVGTSEGETYKIEPLDTEDNLRKAALAGTPPKEEGDFRDADLVDLKSLDPSIKYDIRYATDNNFMGMVFYKQQKAFLQRPAAEAVVKVHHMFKKLGYGLLIHDAYRPWYVTKMFWDATPDEQKGFVANPAKGSRHNRGCAIDLTLYYLETGEPVQMLGGYDEFTDRSFPYYPGGTTRQRWLRDLLRNAMNDAGFTIYRLEWWHFDYKDWEKYRVNNFTFEELEAK